MEPVFTEYVRKPFVVEAIEVTKDNIEALAEFIGTLRKKEDGTTYILVDRRLIPNITYVYPGFWMTRMGENMRCYSRKIFKEQFTPNTPEAEAWLTYVNAQEVQ